MEMLNITIARFDGKNSYDQKYEVPYSPEKTVLSHLFYIKENLDPTLNFSASCRSSICGTCSVRINGVSYLGCDTTMEKMVKKLKTKDLRISPMGNFPILSDLVVDWDNALERLKLTKPLINPKSNYTPGASNEQKPEELSKIALQWDCILCGICASECSALETNPETFLEPFNFVQAERNIIDSRTKNTTFHMKPAMDHGLFNCVRCFHCLRCPKNIKPAGRIAMLRSLSLKHGSENMNEDDSVKLVKAIQKSGYINNSGHLLKNIDLEIKKRTRLAILALIKGKGTPTSFFQGAKPVFAKKIEH